jgi:hypothetical protein
MSDDDADLVPGMGGSSAERKRRPVRGFFSGLVLGVGVVILLFIYGAAAFTSFVPFVLIVAALAVIGVLIGLFAPARRT